MAVLVTLLGVVLALLALLVAGLLRSHAEILRALHDLGVDLDPARAASGGGAAPVESPTVRAGVRSQDVPRRPSRAGADLVGVTPEQDAVQLAVRGVQHLTLVAFLSSGCSTCHEFWDAFALRIPDVPGEARLVITTKDASEESLASIRRLAPLGVPVVMSSAAWEAYDVPVAPFFVLVDGVSGDVVGEGAASTWDQVLSLIGAAVDDAGLVDGKGKLKLGSRRKFRADLEREARADRDLLAAGITPGDPSLYAHPEGERVENA